MFLLLISFLLQSSIGGEQVPLPGAVYCKSLDMDPQGCNAAVNCYHDGEECATHEPGEAPEMENMAAVAAMQQAGANPVPVVDPAAVDPVDPAAVQPVAPAQPAPVQPAPVPVQPAPAQPAPQMPAGPTPVGGVSALNAACGTLTMALCATNPLCDWNGLACSASQPEIQYWHTCRQYSLDPQTCNLHAHCIYDATEPECVSLAESVMEIELRCERKPQAMCHNPCVWNTYEYECTDVDMAEGPGMVCSTLTSPEMCQGPQYAGLCVWMSNTCFSYEAIDMALELQKTNDVDTTSPTNYASLVALGMVGCVLGFGAAILPSICLKKDSLDDVLLETQDSPQV